MEQREQYRRLAADVILGAILRARKLRATQKRIERRLFEIDDPQIQDAYRERLDALEEEIQEELDFLRSGTKNTPDPEAFHVVAGVSGLYGVSENRLKKMIFREKFSANSYRLEGLTPWKG